MALFIPVAAIVFSLKNCEGYIRAILIKQLENDKLSRGAGKRLSPRAAHLLLRMVPALWRLLCRTFRLYGCGFDAQQPI